MALHELGGRSFRQRRCSRFPPRSSNQQRLTRQIDNGVVPSLRARLGNRRVPGDWQRRLQRPRRSTASRFHSCFRIFPRLLSACLTPILTLALTHIPTLGINSTKNKKSRSKSKNRNKSSSRMNEFGAGESDF